MLPFRPRKKERKERASSVDLRREARGVQTPREVHKTTEAPRKTALRRVYKKE